MIGEVFNYISEGFYRKKDDEVVQAFDSYERGLQEDNPALQNEARRALESQLVASGQMEEEGAFINPDEFFPGGARDQDRIDDFRRTMTMHHSGQQVLWTFAGTTGSMSVLTEKHLESMGRSLDDLKPAALVRSEKRKRTPRTGKNTTRLYLYGDGTASSEYSKEKAKVRFDRMRDSSGFNWNLNTYDPNYLALNRLHRRFYDAEDSWNAADDVLKNNLQLSDKDKYSDLYASLNAYDEVFMAGGPIEWYRQNITWYNFRDGNTRDISEERPNTAGKWIPINKRMVDKMNNALLDYGGKLAGTTSLTNEQKRLLAYNNINNSMNSDDTPNERFLFANGWGGYNPRFIAGSDTLSFHAFGAALDFYPGNNKQYIFYTDPTNDNQIFQTNVNNLVRAANNNEKVDTVDEFLEAVQRIKDIRANSFPESKMVMESSSDYSGLLELLRYEDDWNTYRSAINEEILGFEEDFIRSMGGVGFDWGALWHTQLDVMHWQDGNRPEWDEGLESINLYFREQEKPC